MEYRKLSHEEAEIRVLILHHGRHDATVRCTLSHKSLYEEPKYRALSYRWGDEPTLTKRILLNGFERRVTSNLEAALRQLRLDGDSTLWVDALCINQADVEERSLEVLRMKTIYQLAEEVIIWLGPGDISNLRAITVIKSHRSESPESSNSDSIAPEEIIDPASEKALNKFLLRSYWTRVWIIQEVAEAKKKTIHCGSWCLDWSDFENFMLGTKYGRNAIDSGCFFDFWSLRDPVTHERISLVKAIVASRKSDAECPKDKIYALLGLSGDGSDLVPLPNYNLSDEQMFTALARNIWTMKGQLYANMLLVRPSERPPEDCIPTWSPDWSELKLKDKPWIREGLDPIGKEYEVAFQSWMLHNVEKRISKLNLDGLTTFHNSKFNHAASSLNELRRTIRASGFSSSMIRFDSNTLILEGYVLGSVRRLTSRFADDTRQLLIPHRRSRQPSPSSSDESDSQTAKAVLMSLCMISDGLNRLKDIIPKSISPRLFGPNFIRFNSSADLLARLLSPHGARLMRISQPDLLQWFLDNKHFNLGTRELGPFDSWHSIVKENPLQKIASPLIKTAMGVGHDGELQELIDHVASVLKSGMRLMVTESGAIGMAHAQAKRGDQIVMIKDCCMPAILRKHGNGFLVVGEAYLYPPKDWAEVKGKDLDEFRIL